MQHCATIAATKTPTEIATITKVHIPDVIQVSVFWIVLKWVSERPSVTTALVPCRRDKKKKVSRRRVNQRLPCDNAYEWRT